MHTDVRSYTNYSGTGRAVGQGEEMSNDLPVKRCFNLDDHPEHSPVNHPEEKGNNS